MNDQTASQDHNSSELTSAPASTAEISPPDFVSVKLKGVGGWLLFFVIGQLVLRPAKYFGSRGGGDLTAQIAERFPFTATIVNIERVILIGLMILGILVGLALLKTGSQWPVFLTKVYLIANTLSALLLAGLYVQSDLPEEPRNKLIVSGVINFVAISLVCLAWFLYFTRSKRVQATYFGRVM